MTVCTHCGQMLVTVSDFHKHAADSITAYLSDLTEFNATLTGEDKKSLGAFFDAEIHESERWLNFITWLLARNKMEVGEVIDMLQALTKRMQAVLTPNPSKFTSH